MNGSHMWYQNQKNINTVISIQVAAAVIIDQAVTIIQDSY